MQRICKAAQKGGDVSQATAAMAELGNSGQSPQNIQRDWHRMLRRDLQQYFVEPTLVPLPLNGGTTLWPVLAPHESVSMLQRAGRFEKMFLAGMSLDQFWSKFTKEPEYVHLPNIPGFPAEGPGRLTLTPGRIHIDDGRWNGAAKNRTITIVQFGGFSHSSHPYDSRILIAVMPSTFCVKIGTVNPLNQTLEALWQFCTWSFYFAWVGHWPLIPYV